MEICSIIAGIKFIVDIPALIINALITWLVYIGIKESRNFNNLLVILKLAVIFLIIAVGDFYHQFWKLGSYEQWRCKIFMPNGFTGVMSAVAGVFFAYIGFDALSVLSEETKILKKLYQKEWLFLWFWVP